MTDITELTGAPKHANQHRISRIIVESPNDELRQMTVEVEQYTDQLIEALEKAQQRIVELESRTITVKQYDEFQICHYGATEDYAKGYIDCQNNFFKWLTAAGIKLEAE